MFWKRSKPTIEAAHTQREAKLALERAAEARDAAMHAAHEARETARHARELARIAAHSVREQAMNLKGPATQAAGRARSAGLQAWEQRDEAGKVLRKAGTTASLIGKDLSVAARRGVERFQPQRKKKRASRTPWLLGGLGAISVIAVTALPQFRRMAAEQARKAPSLTKNAPERARGVASSAANQAKSLAVAGIPAALRNRFRDSIDEGKQEASETAEEMRNRYKATTNGADQP